MNLKKDVKEKHKQVYDGPCVVIVGPTASGKTSIAIEIARDVPMGAEVISADSRAVYKYMDIGTAKPSLEQQTEVRHHGLDLVEPGERFSVADWKVYAEEKIDEIRKKGKVPIVVGGTGLYIDALVYGYSFIGKTGEKAKESDCYEQKMCSDRQEMLSGFQIFGIKWSNERLRERLAARLNKLFVQELFDETEFLVDKYGWGSQAMKSNIYEYAWGYMNGKYDLEEAKELCFFRDYHLAKRQITWFKRNDKILWLPLDKLKDAVLKCIKNG